MRPLASTTSTRMRDFPISWRKRMRELSFGAYNGTMWRWTWSGGRVWAVVGFAEQPLTRWGYQPDEIAGWGCVTLDEEPHPVVGIYVRKDLRGRGFANQLAAATLEHLRGRIAPGGTVLAVARHWPAWPRVIAKAGYQHEEWT